MSPGPLAPHERPRKKYTARSYSRSTLRPPKRYSTRTPRTAVTTTSIATPPQLRKASTMTAAPWPPPIHADPNAKRPPSLRRRNGHPHHDPPRSEEHTSELQSPCNLVCRLLLEKKKKNNDYYLSL